MFIQRGKGPTAVLMLLVCNIAGVLLPEAIFALCCEDVYKGNPVWARRMAVGSR